MSFLAKLFLDGTEHLILNADILFRQSIDRIQKPNGNPQGGLINITLQVTRDEVFLAWMLAPEKMKNGYIRFYKRDSMSKFADLEFWDCFCVNYYEYFAENTPLTLRLVLSPGVTRFHDVVFEKHWKITDLSQTAKKSTNYIQTDKPKEPVTEEKPKFIECYYSDKSGVKIDKIGEGKATLVVKTKDMIGKTVNIDLADKNNDFIYNDKLLENDMLKDISITSDSMKISLDVIKEKSK